MIRIPFHLVSTLSSYTRLLVARSTRGLNWRGTISKRSTITILIQLHQLPDPMMCVVNQACGSQQNGSGLVLSCI